MRQALAAECDDLRFGGCLTWLERHEGFGALAPLLIRDSDDRALHDGGMPGDRLLYLNR